MAIPIINAKDRPLNLSSSSVPNVSDALQNYFQPMRFGMVTKVTINGQVSETVVYTDFRGVWQPLQAQDLTMMPVGERDWKYYWVHAEIGLSLVPDQVLTYLGQQYRVKSKKDYSLYGYNEYMLVEDYSGSGPYEES